MSAYRGFASLDVETRKAIASRGGKRATRRHRWTKEEAAAAGRAGGLKSAKARAEREEKERAERDAEAHAEAERRAGVTRRLYGVVGVDDDGQ